MKRFFAILMLTAGLVSCGQHQADKKTDAAEEISEDGVLMTVNENGEWTILEEKTVAPAVVSETETFYNLDPNTALAVADPISYNVDLKNYNPNDEWKDEALSKTDRMALANAIFQAVYKGRLTAIDYFSEEPMTIDAVKELEKKYNRSEIGQVMFTEKWYFSESNLTFTKKVESITLAYERKDLKTGENHGFTPAFMVKLK